MNSNAQAPETPNILEMLEGVDGAWAENLVVTDQTDVAALHGEVGALREEVGTLRQEMAENAFVRIL